MKRVSTFAKRLKELREEKGLSLRGLSEEVENISYASISDWETKRYMPNVEAVIELAQFFEVTVGYLLGFEE